MDKPLFDIDQKGMQLTLNSYKPGAGLAWSQLFPLRYTPKFNLKGIEGEEGIPVSADRVAFNAKAPKKTRKKIGTWSGELSKIAVSREKDEKEINEYNDLQTIVASSEDKATAKYLVEMVYGDVDFCNNAIAHKVEIDAMRIGSSGVQTFPKEIEGDMHTEDIINFNVPKENFKGAKIAWGNTKADGIKDIADAQSFIASQGASKPRYAFMEKAKFDELLSQPAVAKRMFPTADSSQITADMMTVESINRYMSRKGYPMVVVVDTYATIEKKDGTKTTLKPWNVNVVALSPTLQLGWTYYKPVPIIPNTDALQAQAEYYKMTRYSELNPMLEVTMAEAYVQPGLINRSSLVFINTTKTSWSDGE